MTQNEARAALLERWLFNEENGMVEVRDAELIRVSERLKVSGRDSSSVPIKRSETSLMRPQAAG